MNASELQALRRLLFFSAAEAARHLAADEERPRGVEERTWNRWEAGKLPVPDNIAATVLQAVQYRAEAMHQLHQRAQSAQAIGQFLNGPSAPVCVLWYAEADDWPGPPLLWRPHQSAQAGAYAERKGAYRLVAFDARAFSLWRRDQGVADTPESRQAWAELQAEAPPATR